MPELPEVEMVRRRILAQGLCRRITRVAVHDERILDGTSSADLRSALKGQHFADVSRRGKQLFLCLDDGHVLTVHLGMTGDVLFLHGQPREDHLRLIVHFKDGCMAYQDQRLFGSIGLIDDIEGFLETKGLGPDALGITVQEFIDNMSGRNKAIKTALLDQSIVAGVGNLYADEVLFQCRIHPLVSVKDLSERRLRCLHRAIQEVMELSIEIGTDFQLMPERYLLHDRTTEAACPRCLSQLAVIKVNGRSSFYCPECQKA